MKKILIPAAALTLIAGNAFAVTFAEVDANQDGWVTPAEFAAAVPEATEDDFTAIDANGDGAISEEEMTAAQSVPGQTNG